MNGKFGVELLKITASLQKRKNFYSAFCKVAVFGEICYNNTEKIKDNRQEQRVEKFLTDVHTHSTFSFDGREDLKNMLSAAYQKGLAFYGVAEHFDYDVFTIKGTQDIDADEYFHTARHLQEDYAGCMNVLIGAEFGYSEDEKVQGMYLTTYKKYRPDFIVNSVHGMMGEDYYYKKLFGEKVQRSKSETYGEYIDLVRKSLDVTYPYDIVGHFGYLTRYAPYMDKSMTMAEFGDKIDDLLKTIISKDKILEANSSTKGAGICVTSEEILRRYYELGGRKVSFASDAHDSSRIADGREAVVHMLKTIGFTYITVPYRGEHIKIEI